MKLWRYLNKIYANKFGYFWLSCPRCGKMFGGHEVGKDALHRTIYSGSVCCKFCEKGHLETFLDYVIGKDGFFYLSDKEYERQLIELFNGQ